MKAGDKLTDRKTGKSFIIDYVEDNPDKTKRYVSLWNQETNTISLVRHKIGGIKKKQLKQKEGRRMKQGYYIEHDGENYRSVFPESEAENSASHTSLDDAFYYMVVDCRVSCKEITVCELR